jgi:hypothetical protein
MISVTQGIQDAFRYLGASWRRWLPMVLLISVFTLVIYAVVYSYVGSTDFRSLYYVDSYTGQIVFEPDAQSKLWSLVLPGLAIGLVYVILNMVAGWVFAATAISGLRNRPLTIAGVVERGLWTIVAGIVIVVAVLVAVIAWVIVTVILFPIGVLLAFAAIPLGIYIEIRLIFISLAIFDGFGPIEGIKEAWRLSNGSVLRMFGWGLMAILITIAFSIAGGLVSAPFTATGAAPVAQAMSGAIGLTASCFTVFMMAVLYESERARKDPNLYGPVPMPMYGGYGYPSAPPAIPGWIDPSAPPAPYGYPAYPAYPAYPPQPPAGYGYPSYPAQPPAGPGWANPSAPPPGYGWVNPAPQPPAFSYPGQAQPGSGWVVPGAPPSAPAYPSAPQGWVAPPAPGPLAPPQSGPAQPSAPEPPAPSDLPTPTDPPAAS